MVGASLQTSQVDSIQSPFDSTKDVNEMVGSIRDASTETAEQSKNDELIASISTNNNENSKNNDDGLVGIASPLAENTAETPKNNANIELNPTIEQTNAAQVDEVVSAPLEPPKDDSQTLVDEKVWQNMSKFYENHSVKLFILLCFR